jgi:hypothetical protein
MWRPTKQHQGSQKKKIALHKLTKINIFINIMGCLYKILMFKPLELKLSTPFLTQPHIIHVFVAT